MSSESKKLFIAATVLLAFFTVFTFAVKFADVAAIGPDESEVGFSQVNYLFATWFPFNSVFYSLSEILGNLGLIVAAFFAVSALYQFCSRKSLFKIDYDIIALGILYIMTAIFYVVFDHVIIINMRPCLMEGQLEVSYPSSHTLLAITVFVSASIVAVIHGKKVLRISALICAGLTVVFRILSGVHWITDIIGGTILALALIYFFVGLLSLRRE